MWAETSHDAIKYFCIYALHWVFARVTGKIKCGTVVAMQHCNFFYFIRTSNNSFASLYTVLITSIDKWSGARLPINGLTTPFVKTKMSSFFRCIVSVIQKCQQQTILNFGLNVTFIKKWTITAATLLCRSCQTYHHIRYNFVKKVSIDQVARLAKQ